MGLWSPVDDVKVEKEEEERKEMDNLKKNGFASRCDKKKGRKMGTLSHPAM